MHYPYHRTLPIFNAHTFRVLLDANHLSNLTQLYHELSTRFHFPDYFNSNLDSLFDCLCDLSQLPDKYTKAVLVIYHSENFLLDETDEHRKAVYQALEQIQDPENRYDHLQFEVYLLRDS